jgi:hypothetical protein
MLWRVASLQQPTARRTRYLVQVWSALKVRYAAGFTSCPEPSAHSPVLYGVTVWRTQAPGGCQAVPTHCPNIVRYLSCT